MENVLGAAFVHFVYKYRNLDQYQYRSEIPTNTDPIRTDTEILGLYQFSTSLYALIDTDVTEPEHVDPDI